MFAEFAAGKFSQINVRAGRFFDGADTKWRAPCFNSVL